jgi:hypothetical protein
LPSWFSFPVARFRIIDAILSVFYRLATSQRVRRSFR